MSVGSSLTFNMNDGYLEAILRGYRGVILTTADYANLVQCEELDDMRLHLAQTDYGDFLANEPAPLRPNVIQNKCNEKMVAEFLHIRNQAVEPLASFLDYVTYGYMIDNIVLLITGTLHERDMTELIEKCHPLGMFDAMASLTVAHNVSELYNSVLVDTPLAPYFQGCLSEEDLDEVNIELIRNTLYKAYLEDFYQFCKSLGGPTAEVMCELLEFEADRRSINITLNSFGTDLSKDDREKLYPRLGLLHPEGLDRLAKADDADSIYNTVEMYLTYRPLLESVGGQYGVNEDRSLEDAFFEHEVKLNKLSFELSFHYGVFYSWVKLKEQEIRNIVWIAECIAQKQKSKINHFIPIF